jgi:hypothetical protein
MFWKSQGITLLAGLLVCLAACEKRQPAPPPEKPVVLREALPERVGKKSPEAILQTLHHAAQEMALDGFQFDKPELGWPFDCRASTSSGYLRLLADKGYLAPQDLELFSEVDIANLSDSDPGETAFAKIQLRKKIHFIQKDGSLLSESNDMQPPPLPPRDPAWLPK